MEHYLSPSHFITKALKLTVPVGDEEGYCVLCGTVTETGLNVKQHAGWVKGNPFTDINRTVYNASNVICSHCVGMGSSFKYPNNQLSGKSIQAAYHQRLARSVITDSGKVLFLGNHARLKWLLHNMPDEPFLLANEMGSGKNFSHLLWHTQVSMSKDCFFYCDKSGNHLVRLKVVTTLDTPADATVKELHLHYIYHGEAVYAMVKKKKVRTDIEQPLHPKEVKYS